MYLAVVELFVTFVYVGFYKLCVLPMLGVKRLISGSLYLLLRPKSETRCKSERLKTGFRPSSD